MKQVHFSIQINAPKEKVWSTLLDDKTYREWTSIFNESSYAVGDWSEGSKVLFLSADGSGLSSRVFKHVPNEFISIQHLGTIANGVEDFDSEETKKWAGSLENYSVSERNGITELLIEMDQAEGYEAFFLETWPKALARVKALAEAKTAITVETTVQAPVEQVWKYWTAPEHITQWNHASDDWYCPRGVNDLRPGGKFSFTMAARDGSAEFDFAGVYDDIQPHKKIAYTLGDERKVEVVFSQDGSSVKVVETFDAENMHAHEMQRAGWQAILDNFKKYAEAHG